MKINTEYAGKYVWKVIRIVALGFLAFIVLYPFLWMLVTSFKAEADIVSFPPKLFPGGSVWIPILAYGTGSLFSNIIKIRLFLPPLLLLCHFCSIPCRDMRLPE